MTILNRRCILGGLGAIGAGTLWKPPAADALGLPTDKIKSVHYYTSLGDSTG